MGEAEVNGWMECRNFIFFVLLQKMALFFKTSPGQGLPCLLTHACRAYDHLLPTPSTGDEEGSFGFDGANNKNDGGGEGGVVEGAGGFCSTKGEFWLFHLLTTRRSLRGS